MNFLQGYKTYIAAAGLLIVGLVEGFAGIDIPGVVLGDNWIMTFLGALGLTGLRSAIGKAPSQ